MADSSSSQVRSLIIRILRPPWKVKITKGLMSLLLKSSPGDLNRQNEPKIERESQRRIKSLCAVAASIKKATNGECITLVNKVFANQSLIEYRSDQVKKTN